ncbi:MAG: hypothetical protein NXY57DRAFT_966272 [Lentinula lateritia]|nr:MAG: hypothetical protein NXY57DRAFT_966272 [Lentinula lateritia]
MSTLSPFHIISKLGCTAASSSKFGRTRIIPTKRKNFVLPYEPTHTSMSVDRFTALCTSLLEGFYYLGNQRPLPEGCRWTTLDGKQFVTVPVMHGNPIPTIAPFTVVGHVATNLKNTGLLGSWSRNSKFSPETTRHTFQIGPPIGHVFQQDWAPAMLRVKELQLAGSNNSRKVQYLFVHENVAPVDCILRAGAQDLEDGEDNKGLKDAIPRGKEDDPAWIDIVDTKNFSQFPLYDIDGELIPLRCWHFAPTDPYSFAADIKRVDILLPAHKSTLPMSLPPTPPKTPKASMTDPTPDCPAHHVQALYMMPHENVATGRTNFTASSSPQTPTHTTHHSNTLEGTPTTTYLSPTGTATSMSPDDAQYCYRLYSPTLTPSVNQQTTVQRSPPDEFTMKYPARTNHQPMDTWYNTTYEGNREPVLTSNLGPPFEHVYQPPDVSDSVNNAPSEWTPPAISAHVGGFDAMEGANRNDIETIMQQESRTNATLSISNDINGTGEELHPNHINKTGIVTTIPNVKQYDNTGSHDGDITKNHDLPPFSTWPGPTQDLLLRGLDPTDLHHFGLVNRQWYQVTKSFQRRAYKRSKTLDHYFDEHQQKYLQLFQAKTGALLAGEPVDCFFARENNEGELVIIVPIVDVMALGCWLAFNSFCYDARRNPLQSFPKTVKDEMHRVHKATERLPASTCTFHFTKDRCPARGGSPISVAIVSATCAPMEVVLNAPLSDGMCFFTHTNAIALFPYCSYVHKETLEITGNLDIQPHYCLNGSIHRKWFDSVDAIDASHRRSEFASHRIRFVGDDNCFIVALEAPPSVALIPDFVFITSWEMDYTMRDPSLKFEVIRGPSRRYYCIAQAEMFRWEAHNHNSVMRTDATLSAMLHSAKWPRAFNLLQTAAGELLTRIFHHHNAQWDFPLHRQGLLYNTDGGIDKVPVPVVPQVNDPVQTTVMHWL